MVVPDITTRTCTRCGKSYPLTIECFRTDKQNPSGYMRRCRFCMEKIRSEYRKRPYQKERHNAYRRERHRKLQEELETNRAYALVASVGEMWMTVKGNDHYEVSNLGGVRSKRVTVKFPTGRLLRPNTHSNGYVRIPLYDNGTRKLHWVHRLVAEAFLGDAPSPSHQVNHKDGNPGNNHVSNLEYVTPAENKLHSIGVLHRRRSLIPETIRCAIWRDYKIGAVTRAELSRKYGVPWMQVHNAIQRYELLSGGDASETKTG